MNDDAAVTATEPGTASAETNGAKRSGLRSLVEWVVLIGAAMAVALIVRAFLLQVFYIPSDSMVPTLIRNDRVLVNKLSYDLHDVNRGDIVVFHRPPAQAVGQIEDLIKRVVALPGETVEGRGGRVWVDGRPLQEAYLPPGEATSEFAPVTVPPGRVFVMGDNRGDSQDSRVFGPVEQSLIKGRAFVRIWPPSRLDGL